MSKAEVDSELQWCSKDSRTGDFGRLRVDDLRPTQFATGKAEVLVKAARLRRKHESSPQKLIDYLVVRPVPVVLRHGDFYLIDHHHMVRALFEALGRKRGKDLEVYAEVVARFDAVSDPCFWRTMYKRNWVYLFSRSGGGPQLPSDLPKHTKDLEFDSYRSLAWLVRERHGYAKNDAPFSEFKWANFFRTRLLIDQHILEDKHAFDRFAFDVTDDGKLELTDEGIEVVEDALALAASPEARGLPGYRGSV